MADSDCAGFSAGPAICSVDLVCVPSAQTSDPPQDQVPDSPGDNPPPDDEGAPIGGTGGTGGLVGTGGTGGAAPTGGTGGAVETGGTGGVANASGGSGNGGTVPLGPATVAWTNTETRPTLGDSTGGTAFLAKCEDDEVLVGLKVAAGAWTDQVTGICQPTFVNEDSTNQPSEYVLTLGQRRNLMSYPATTTSQVHDLTCAEGSAVVGMRISQQNSGDPAAVVIPRVWLTCAELYLSNPTGSGEIRWRNPFEIGPISGSYANDTAWFASDSLPEGTLTVGVHGASGSWVDRVGLVAAPVAVTTGQ